MTKVINFPQKIDSIFPTTSEEADEHIKDVRTKYCEEITSDVLDGLVSVLLSYGVHLKPQGNSVKDIIFLEESIKAVLFRTKGIEHPFHDMIDKSIVLPDEAEEKIKETIKENVLT